MTGGQIHEALAGVMADVSHVAKRDVNQHQRFHFRGIDAVVNAVGPVLRKHRVTVRPVVQHVSYDVVQTTTGKPATACRVIVDYVFGAPDGSELTATVAAEAWDAGDKAAPKAMSVAFRTALLQTLALPTDEPDPDSHSYTRDYLPQGTAPHQQVTKEAVPRITEQQSKRLHALANDLQLDREKKLKAASWSAGREITTTADLTTREAGDLIDYLATRLRDMQRDAPQETA